MSAEQTRPDVAAIVGEIVAAKRLARAGRAVDLDGLDARIGQLCETVIAMPRHEGQAMLPLLDDLRLSLDELADTLKTAAAPDQPPASP